MTTHNPDHAIMLGGKTAILDENGILEVGNSEEIITEDVLKKIYKTDIKLMYLEDIGRKICVAQNLDSI
ncbi:Iron(III) ABC transporter, ATP-binding protein [Lachnospiraceae bacterium TWA4]|nr:Iron(III) ABC transporter, ATP-binding protein [Lachnospiraceae bacterium TWA4]